MISPNPFVSKNLNNALASPEKSPILTSEVIPRLKSGCNVCSWPLLLLDSVLNKPVKSCLEFDNRNSQSIPILREFSTSTSKNTADIFTSRAVTGA